MKTKRSIKYRKNNRTFKKYYHSGGDIKYILDEINHVYNKSYNKAFPYDTRDYINGEFVVHKEFKVKSKCNPKSKNVSGYVIQKVEKKTVAYTIKDGIETLIPDISKFTSDYVKYMNDSYYELFFIINGESTDGDNFQNGAILEYTYDELNNSYGPDDRTDTKGTIKIKGTSWFIEAKKDDVYNNYNLVSENNIKTINILGLEWSLNKDTPANGLPYISISESAKINNIPKSSNILEHNVEVKWDTTKKIKNESESFTKSEFKKIA